MADQDSMATENTMAMADITQLMTVAQFASLLGDGKRHLDHAMCLAESGELPSIYINDVLFLKAPEVKEYLDARESGRIDGAMFTPWSVIQRFLPATAAWATDVANGKHLIDRTESVQVQDDLELMALAMRVAISLENKQPKLHERFVKYQENSVERWKTNV